MERKELLKRKEEMLRLKKEGYEFEEYQPYLPEAEDDIRLATHYKFRDLIIDFKRERIQQNLTQEDIAVRMGTKQTSVSRFESYDTKPTIAFLMKYAKALGKDMLIKLDTDFIIELPADYREQAKSLCLDSGSSVKQILIDGLVRYVQEQSDKMKGFEKSFDPVNSIDAVKVESETTVHFIQGMV
ncbi:MAG: helix-turn-helix transcriptional regulator [Candidatus Syntrophosphaera sp.]|nr:helix-turn-helix transcriptional regulator [Candidatus Syntrophosphaera sp.]